MDIDQSFVIDQSAEIEIKNNFKDHEVLRIEIVGGGCQGYQYKFSTENIKNIINKSENDEVFDHQFLDAEKKKIMVIIDSTSMDFLKNAILFFKNDFMNKAFVIKNKSASSGCGCGESFSFKKQN